MTAKKTNTPKLARDLWKTPDWFYEPLCDEFHFEIDAAADRSNAKCDSFFSEKDSAFDNEWDASTFCNPPYSVASGGTLKWIMYGYEQSQLYNIPVVFIVQGDTSTKYRRFAMEKAFEIRDLVHRVEFVGAPGTPPWPTAVYVFRPMIYRRIAGGANISLWDYRESLTGVPKL